MNNCKWLYLWIYRHAAAIQRRSSQKNFLQTSGHYERLKTAHYDANNALADSQALQWLVLHLEVSREMMIKHSFSVDFVIENDNYRMLLSKNASSLKRFV